MFRKLMNMSDALTWRYYELLTDLSLNEIEKMKMSLDPLAAKKDLAKRIVSEFHSPGEAERVAASWGGLPPVETLEHHTPSDARLNRVLNQARFVASVSEADKMIKAGSVEVFALPSEDDVPFTGPAHRLTPGEYIVRVGRKLKHVTVLTS
jgi:tyrosyl-tRNA synthetase